jgi:integrase
MKPTKPTKPLTDATCRAIKSPGAGSEDTPDIRSPGLFLRVTAAGARSWTFRFTDPVSGQRARMALGRYPDLSLAGAREAADGKRELIAAGKNPIEVKRQERAEAPSRTFQALSERYITEHARRFKKSADADERNLRLHILPAWGKRTYASITRADIIALVEGLIVAGKPILANRVQALVSKIFSFAVDAALLDAHPAARLRKRGVEHARKRVLSSDAEIRLFWSRIMAPPVAPAIGLALRLALLTGLRAGEVAGIHRNEILALDDADNAAFLIGGERTKNGRAHLVPLSPMARELVADARALSESADHLFPSRTKAGEAINPHALANAMSRFADVLPADDDTATWKAEPPTPHDLRRTFATRMSALGVAKEDRDALLNHARNDVGSRHYDQHDRAREKRAALNRWAVALTAIINSDGRGAEIVPLRRLP